MPKLEDVLKQRGYTDADLANMSTLLSDQKFRSSIEASFDEIDANARKARDDEWFQIRDTEWQTKLNEREKETRDARLETARLREENAIAKEWGYLEDPEAKARLETLERERQQQREQTRDQLGRFNAKDPEFQQFANNFSKLEGDAIALYHNLSDEYRHLTGQSLYDYTRSESDGRTSRGMVALRNEWLGLPNRPDFETFVGHKFDFAGKRADAAKKAQEAHDAEVARKAVEDFQLKNPQSVNNPNPMLYGSSLSNAPFIPASNGKQPWEDGRTGQERRASRISNAMQSEIKSRTSVQ